jgi:integrase
MTLVLRPLMRLFGYGARRGIGDIVATESSDSSLSTIPDAVSKLLTSLSQCGAGTPLFPFSAGLLNRHLIRLSRKGGQPPPPLGRFTCPSLRSGCISAALTIGIPLARIMALSGHSSPQVLIRHYLDASIAPCPSAREMFGRLSSS